MSHPDTTIATIALEIPENPTTGDLLLALTKAYHAGVTRGIREGGEAVIGVANKALQVVK